jgi:hypothetical protein
MPDRMIREGLIASARINCLDDRTECLFVRLLLKVDAGGVFHAEPELVKSACWPLKSYRLADVVRSLDALERAGLVARWTDGDGSRWLCLLRFRQKLKWQRRQYPKPPFDDQNGQYGILDEVGEADEPPPPHTPPKKRSEEKRKGGAQSARTPPPPESLDDFKARMRVAYPGIDIEEQLRQALKAKAKEGRELELGWFELNWLPKCTISVTAFDLAQAKRPVLKDEQGPNGWEKILEDTSYGPGGLNEAKTWSELPEVARNWVHERLKVA